MPIKLSRMSKDFAEPTGMSNMPNLVNAKTEFVPDKENLDLGTKHEANNFRAYQFEQQKNAHDRQSIKNIPALAHELLVDDLTDAPLDDNEVENPGAAVAHTVLGKPGEFKKLGIALVGLVGIFAIYFAGSTVYTGYLWNFDPLYKWYVVGAVSIAWILALGAIVHNGRRMRWLGGFILVTLIVAHFISFYVEAGQSFFPYISPLGNSVVNTIGVLVGAAALIWLFHSDPRRRIRIALIRSKRGFKIGTKDPFEELPENHRPID